MQRLMAIVVIAALCAPALGDAMTDPGIQVGHNGNYNGWRGWNNNARDGTPWIDSWCDSDDWGSGSHSDHCIVQFDRAAIQDAINANIANYGTWDAFLLATPREALDPGTNPVCGVFNVDAINWASTTMHSSDDGNGASWAYSATNYNSLELAIKAGAGIVVEDMPWSQTNYNDPIAHNKIRIDIPESVVEAYLNNDDYDGWFVTNKDANDTNVAMYAGNQWGVRGYVLLEITPEPATIMLIGLGGLGLLLRKRR